MVRIPLVRYPLSCTLLASPSHCSCHHWDMNKEMLLRLYVVSALRNPVLLKSLICGQSYVPQPAIILDGIHNVLEFGRSMCINVQG